MGTGSSRACVGADRVVVGVGGQLPAHPPAAQQVADLAQRRLELVGDWAVDEEVGGEVEHDEQVRHALQAHDPQRRDVVVHSLDTLHLDIWQVTYRC